MAPQEKKTDHADAFQLIVDMYMLLMLADYEAPKRNDISDFQKRGLVDFKERYIEKASLAYLDYIVHATLGENLHSSSEASHIMFSPKPTTLINDYGTVSNKARSYSWQSLLKTMRKAFGEYEWDSGYGGNSWATIADAGLMFGTVPAVVFLDHVVDLAHNGGLFLDKGGPLQLSRPAGNYMEFLEAKKNATSAIELMNFIVRKGLPLSKTVWDRFKMLYPAYDEKEISSSAYHPFTIRPEPSYNPIKFGTKELKAKFKKNPYWGLDSGDGDGYPTRSLRLL